MVKTIFVFSLLILGFSSAVNAQAPTEDNSPAELNRPNWKLPESDSPGPGARNFPPHIARLPAELNQRNMELYGHDKLTILRAENAVAIAKRVNGDSDRETAQSLNILAGLYRAKGDYPKAEAKYNEAATTCQKALENANVSEVSPQNADTWGTIFLFKASILNNLGDVYRETNDFGEAEAQYKEAATIFQKVLETGNVPELVRDPQNADTWGTFPAIRANILNKLGDVYRQTDDFVKAEARYKEALAIVKKLFDPQDPDTRGILVPTAMLLTNLGDVYRETDDFVKAETRYKEALAIFKEIEAPPSVWAITENSLADLYLAMGDCAKAEPLYKVLETVQKEKLLDPRDKEYGGDYPERSSTVSSGDGRL